MISMQLPLRDVHAPVAPPWWPPAPGWWLVAGAVLLLIAAMGWLAWRRARRRRRIGELFDRTVDAAQTPPAQVAAMSALLRRAARARVPGADVLQGEAWLRLLDQGLDAPLFSAGAGRVLLDGAYRPDLEAGEVAALRPIARARFLDWMRAGR